MDAWTRTFLLQESVPVYIFLLNGLIRLYHTTSTWLEIGPWRDASAVIDERPIPIQRDEAMVKWVHRETQTRPAEAVLYAWEHNESPTRGTRTTVNFWKKTGLPFEHRLWDGSAWVFADRHPDPSVKPRAPCPP